MGMLCFSALLFYQRHIFAGYGADCDITTKAWHGLEFCTIGPHGRQVSG